MKNKKSLMIAVFLLSIFVILLNDTEAVNVCCEKSGENYCVFTDNSECDSSYDSFQFACSAVNQCEQVCCIDNDGVCSEGMTRAQCLDQGGTAREGACNAYLECQVGSCVIGGQCSTGITNRECRQNADMFNVTYTFDPSINTIEECRAKYSRDEGCCISSSGCTRTTSALCDGDFKAGQLCSNSDFIGLCTNQKQFTKRCGPDGEDVYWYDSNGQLENIVGVPYDGRIKTEQQAQGAVGDCDYVAGNICGIGKNGEYECVTLDCEAGNRFVVPDYIPGTQESNDLEIEITRNLLGGKDNRTNGESWCFMSSYNYDKDSMDRGYYDLVKAGNKGEDLILQSFGIAHQKYSPGARHTVLSCNQGRVEVEPCDTFRGTVCKEAVRPNTRDVGAEIAYTEERIGPSSSADCVDNKAGECREIGSDDECERRGDFCVLNTQDINECWPRPEYALGFEFWEDNNIRSQNERQCSSKCGEGVDVCDDDECWSLGDCETEDRGVFGGWGGALTGCAVGAGVAAFGHYIPGVGDYIESGTLRAENFLRDIFGVAPKVETLTPNLQPRIPPITPIPPVTPSGYRELIGSGEVKTECEIGKLQPLPCH